MMGDMAPGDLVDMIEDLRVQVTTLKAERDEAIQQGERWWQRLLDLLARIHRDGGHYTDQHGIVESLEEADRLLSILLVQRGHL